MGLFGPSLTFEPGGKLPLVASSRVRSDLVVFAPLGAVETAAPIPPADFGARPTPAARQRAIIVVLRNFELNRDAGTPHLPYGDFLTPKIWSKFVVT